MSIRIHELAKKHNMEGRDMLALLKERGYVAADTKSVSSTVSKIYIEEIDKEFAAKAAPVQAAAPAEHPAPAAPAPAAEPSRARMPVGIFVKTAQDVAREQARRLLLGSYRSIWSSPEVAATAALSRDVTDIVARTLAES